MLKRKTWYAARKEKESSNNTNHQTDMMSNNKKIKKIFHKNKNKVMPRINTTTVVIVPSTKNGILVRKLKETEEEMAIMSDFRIRFQEAGGSKLSNQFNTNLSHGQHCGRICYPCECNGEKRENCRAKNITYQSCCKECNTTSQPEHCDSGKEPEPREGIYIGESSRSLHERTMEHIKDAEDFSPKSLIIKHWRIMHP